MISEKLWGILFAFFAATMILAAPVSAAAPATGLATYEIFGDPFCGDLVCDAGEDCNVCADDCGACVPITAPTVAITSPASGAAITSSSVSMSYSSVAGTNPISKYLVQIDSAGWVDNGLNTSYNFSGVSEGGHTLHAKATDTVGTESGVSSVAITVSAPSGGGGESPPPASGGGDSPPAGGGGSGGGGGGGGGGAALGAGGLKASMRNLQVSGTALSTPIEVSVLVSHGIPTAQTFVIKASIVDSAGNYIYTDEATVGNLPGGRAMKVIFEKKWEPKSGGDYNLTATLYAKGKSTIYDFKKTLVEIRLEALPRPSEGPILPPAKPAGGENGEAKVPDQNLPIRPVPPKTGNDSTIVIAGVAIIVAAVGGYLAFRKMKENAGGQLEDQTPPENTSGTIEELQTPPINEQEPPTNNTQ